MLFAPLPDEPDLYLATFPTGFRIDYAINGHMHEGMVRWRANAMAILSNVRVFWRDGAAVIRQHGGTFITAPYDARSPDDIFDADTCIAFINEAGKKIALMSRMRHAERRLEIDHARRALRAQGFTTYESETYREGSGDTLFDPNFGVYWTGVGKRTAPNAGRQLSELSGRPVFEIPTRDEKFYHIDTFLSFLPGGHVVLYKEAMSKESYDLLCSFYPDSNKRLELTKEEAMKFAANLQFVSPKNDKGMETHHVLTPHDCPRRVFDQLQEWGYKTEPLNIYGVRLAGGGAHCCYQKVWDLRRYAQKPLPAMLPGFAEASRQNLGFWPKNAVSGLVAA